MFRLLKFSVLKWSIIIGSVLVVGLVVWLVIIPMFNSGSQSGVDSLVNRTSDKVKRAVELNKSGDTEGAVTLLESAVKDSSSDDEKALYYKLQANILLENGYVDRATESSEKSSELNTDDVSAAYYTLVTTSLAPSNSGSETCSGDLLRDGLKAMVYPIDEAKFKAVIDKMTAIPGYFSDVNCVYFVTEYYIYMNNTTSARTFVDKLKVLYVQSGGYDKIIADQALLPADLEERVSTLESNLKQIIENATKMTGLGDVPPEE